MVAEHVDHTWSPSVESGTTLVERRETGLGERTGAVQSSKEDGTIILVPGSESFPSPHHSSAYWMHACRRLLGDRWPDTSTGAGLLPGEREELQWEARNIYSEIDLPRWRRRVGWFMAMEAITSAASAASAISASLASAMDSLPTVLNHAIEAARVSPEMLGVLRDFAHKISELDLTVADVLTAAESVEAGQAPWHQDLQHLKEYADLTDAEIGELFGVTRSSVQGWLHRGQGMRSERQQHLRAMLSVIEDAFDRAKRDRRRLRYTLFSEVSESGKRPFDYLKEQKYRMARGFLVTALSPKPTLTKRRRFLEEYAVELPIEVRDATLEELSPPPRID